MAHDTDQLEWLARDARALSVINDPFLAYNIIHQQETRTQLLAWAVRERTIPVVRLQYLVDQCGVQVNEAALVSAVVLLSNVPIPADFEVVRFLEARGARHNEITYGCLHLHRLLQCFGPESVEALEFAWENRQLLHVSPDANRIIFKARYRIEQARKAALVVAGLGRRRRQHLPLGKDVAALVGRRMVAPGHRVDPKWGDPGLREVVRENKWLTASAVICLIMMACLVWVWMNPVPVAQPGMHSAPWAGPGPRGDRGEPGVCFEGPRGLQGPQGPPGPPGVDWTVSQGTGIHIPGSDQKIKNG